MYIERLVKKQVTLAVVTFLMLGIIVIGSSYALFQETFTDTNTQSLNVGDLSIAFSNGVKENGEYTNNLADSNAVDLSDILPMTDAEAIEKTDNVYNFVIYNSGTIPYTYTIKLSDNLEDENVNVSNLLSHNFIRYKLNDNDPDLLGNATNDIIYNYVVNPGETHTFTLRVWVAEAEKYGLTNDVFGQEVHLNILIEGEASSFRAPQGWTYAKEGTLLAGIKGNQDRAYNEQYNPLNKTLTAPGVDSSTSAEGLRDAPDDYGASYYFRGAVDNNFVVFANMCWRIVRVDGNGNIKLVLYNYNDSSVANPCLSTYDDPSAAFARYDGSANGAAGISAFKASPFNKNTYVGFMYSNTPDSNDYDESHANNTPSTILTSLMSFYNTYLRTPGYDTKLADVVWCNDISVASSNYNPGAWTDEAINTGVASVKTNYKATERLFTTASAAPSFKCPDASGDNLNLSKFTASSDNGNGALTISDQAYKIGLLTADEVVFAGTNRSNENSDYYLAANASGKNWWTMTPYHFDGSSARIWYIGDNGRLQYSLLSSKLGVRPAVALKSNVKYKLNNGSTNAGKASNPFVIVDN